jgi:cold shock protein
MHYEGFTAFGPPSAPGRFLESVGITYTAAQRQKRKSQTMRQRGIIKKWIELRGFGFAKRDGDADDIFIHASQLLNGLKLLNVGDLVEFDIVADKKDPTRSRAVAVSVVA